MNTRRRGLPGALILGTVSVVVGVLLFELAAQWLLERSPAGRDELLGVWLPPRSVIPPQPPPSFDSNEPYDDLIVGGKRISKGDLWGIMREDPIVGYVPRESSVSANGWWRSNDVGARHDVDLRDGESSQYGTRRILVFGESFTQGSRLPQEDTWVYQLAARHPAIEPVNFGVDGYGMAQCLLRYRTVADQVRHNAVAFVFLPTADLWRDVNTIRSLAEPWHSFAVLPRFVPENGNLYLARSPYGDVDAMYRENRPVLSKELRDHLRLYDRFYVPMLYEASGMADFPVSARLIAAYLGQRKLREIRRQMFYDPDSEAWRTVREIFLSAKRESENHGAEFVVIIMPTHDDVATAADYEDFRLYWAERVDAFRHLGIKTLDLLPALSMVAADLDYGYDGSHYGPAASAHIATVLSQELSFEIKH